MGRLAGEEQRGLAGRVAAADHDDRIVLAPQRLHLGRGVIDARSLESGQAGQIEPAVTGTGRDHHHPPADRRPVDEYYPAALISPGDACRGRGHVDPGAELAGLDKCPVGQFATGDPRWEAEE